MKSLTYTAVAGWDSWPLPAEEDSGGKSLVDRLRGGEAGAYEVLVRDYGGRMFAVAQRLLPSPDDSADAVQDAFISAFQSMERFEGNCKLSTWLHRITVNACLMLLRTRGRQHTVSLHEAFPQFDSSGHHASAVSNWDDPWSRVVAGETSMQIKECIDLLPDAYRTVLVLRDIEELDTEQAARALNTTPGNIKTRLHRARQCLRTLFENRFGDL